MFKEWQKGSFIRLVKNPNYHEQGKPYIDEIYWQIIPDAAARSVAFETGKVDVLSGGAMENFDVSRLSKLKGACVTGEGWEFYNPLSFLWLNNRSGPTANKKVRQAILSAIDRNFAKDVIWNGLGKVATGPSNSTIKFYTDEVAKYPFDLSGCRDSEKGRACNTRIASLGSSSSRSIDGNFGKLSSGMTAMPATKRLKAGIIL
jgi:peptide/nickel transport system substrate-binding protein